MSKRIAKSYLPKMEKTIHIFLERRFNEKETEALYQKVQKLDQKYRLEEPYIGGRDNVMSDNLYQSFCMFALYEALDRKMTDSDIQELIDIYFEQMTQHMPDDLDLSFIVHSKFVSGALYKYLNHYASKANAKKGNVWANTWGIEVNPDHKDTGIALNLVGCPLADFARKHDMMKILPLLCNIDHRTVDTLGLKLFRDQTVSNGDDKCAYWYVDKKSEEADTFTNEMNEKGLLISVMNADNEPCKR